MLHPTLSRFRVLLLQQHDVTNIKDACQLARSIENAATNWVEAGCPVSDDAEERWGHVEVMGHSELYGLVVKTTEHGIPMLRVTEPAFELHTQGEDEPSRYSRKVTELGPKALFRVTFQEGADLERLMVEDRASVPSYLEIEKVGDGVWKMPAKYDNVEPFPRAARVDVDEDDIVDGNERPEW